MRHTRYIPIQQVTDSHPIRATCFHPSGEAFVVGTNSKALKICKYPNAERRQELVDNDGLLEEPELSFTCIRIHCASVYCARFNPSGNLLATGSNDQVVHIMRYDPSHHAPVGGEYKLAMHNGTVRDVCFLHEDSSSSASPFSSGATPSSSPCTSRLLSAGAGDFGVYLTDATVMKPTRMFKGHESTVMSLDSCIDSANLFVSGSLDGTIRLWDVRSRDAISKITGRLQASVPKQPEQQHEAGAQQAQVAPPQEPDHGHDTSFDAPTNQTRVLGSAVRHTGQAGDEFCDRTQEHNNQENQHPAMGELRMPRRPPPPPPPASLGVESHRGGTTSAGVPVGVVRLDPTGRLLVSGHKDGTCMFYDVRAGKIIQLLQMHSDEIRALNFSPKSYYLLTGSYDRKVKLIDLQGQLTQPLPNVEAAELEDKVVQLAWHPSDYNFVTTSAEGSATLWSVPDFDDWRDSQVMETSLVADGAGGVHC